MSDRNIAGCGLFVLAPAVLVALIVMAVLAA